MGGGIVLAMLALLLGIVMIGRDLLAEHRQRKWSRPSALPPTIGEPGGDLVAEIADLLVGFYEETEFRGRHSAARRLAKEIVDRLTP